MSNEIGRAHRGQRTLSEASSDLAGSIGLDFIGELIGSAVVGTFRAFVPKKAAPAVDVFEIPEDEAEG